MYGILAEILKSKKLASEMNGAFKKARKTFTFEKSKQKRPHAYRALLLS